MPEWTDPRGKRPPDPDHVAPRGTSAYNNAVQQLHAWQAKNIARGVPMEMVVDRYDDYGNDSHDWKQWTGKFEGTESARPMEYMKELWDIGNFQKNISKQEEDGGFWGDYHKDPVSGMFFNDPGNDFTKRTWYDDWGDLLPNAPGRGPEVEYDSRGRMYFVDRSKEKLAPPGEQVYGGAPEAPPVAPIPHPIPPTPVISQSPVIGAGMGNVNAWGAPSNVSQNTRPQRYNVNGPQATVQSLIRPTRYNSSQPEATSFDSFGSKRPLRYTKSGFSRGF